MRDATFALWGLYTLGFEWEASDYFAFLRDLVERDCGDLQIVYGIDGRANSTSTCSTHLNGYQGARPVRIGKRRVPAGPARRLGRSAGFHLPAHQVTRPAG